MEFRQLEYVVGVVDHGGFTRAATALHVSQPSLSQGIRTLERELGTELFHRLGRDVALTAAGEALLEPARQALREASTIRAVVAEVAGLASGHLDLVALPTLAVDPLAAMIGRFRRSHPGVTVRVSEPEDADAIGELVRSGQSEIGLADLPLPAADLVTRHLLDQDVLAVCPPGTALGKRRRLPVARLAGMPLVTTPPGTSTRRLVDQALATAAIEPHVAVETTQREALLPPVLAGAGTSFLPAPLAREAARQGAVVARLDPPLRRSIGLVWRHGPLSPAARAFIAEASEATGASQATGARERSDGRRPRR